MPEYIEREALIKESTFMFDYALGHCKCVLVEDILNIPAADVVEVVRCKKCEHYNTSNCADGFGWCEKHNRGEMDDHFCSYGERRTDNG